MPTKTVLQCQECLAVLTKRTRVGWEAEARAAVAMLGVVDRDGDIVEAGALVTDGPAQVSHWNHSSMRHPSDPEHVPPVGRAELVEAGDVLMASVWFDDTPEGRATCERVMKEKPDWSVGYRVLKYRAPTPAEKAQGARRVIQLWEVFEVSPVDKGAGISTGTHSACCGACTLTTGSDEARRGKVIASLEASAGLVGTPSPSPSASEASSCGLSPTPGEDHQGNRPPAYQAGESRPDPEAAKRARTIRQLEARMVAKMWREEQRREQVIESLEATLDVNQAAIQAASDQRCQTIRELMEASGQCCQGGPATRPATQIDERTRYIAALTN